mgnify:FL=1
MKLLLKRLYKKSEYTIGNLYIDGTFFCNTLEDTDRGSSETMPIDEIKRLKQSKITAIPTGTYNVVLNVVSPKYSTREPYKSYCNGWCVPRLLNVPGYEGILIHIGNYPKDTDGCILVGENKKAGAVINSTDTFKKVYDALQAATDKITITIV